MESDRPRREPVQSLAERRIREAQDRGEFDHLPGRGKAIPGLDKPHDDLWWVKQLIKRENLPILPMSLVLTREIRDEVRSIPNLASEDAVRRKVRAINERIRRMNRTPDDGPPSRLALVDIEEVLGRWRRHRKC
jgi:hypothetical protein